MTCIVTDLERGRVIARDMSPEDAIKFCDALSLSSKPGQRSFRIDHSNGTRVQMGGFNLEQLKSLDRMREAMWRSR